MIQLVKISKLSKISLYLIFLKFPLSYPIYIIYFKFFYQPLTQLYQDEILTFNSCSRGLLRPHHHWRARHLSL
ncbi:hypothetical protein FGO68_gene5973 [Halteria grandinella]|uniref:Uncharacterized protein n=1 Tax=Halteria grandinella TaxID=5974 RepID=A0A8J8T477_HALGN|nr:hypothetical protein FGO68_gene5973 [Halteria grandinella]